MQVDFYGHVQVQVHVNAQVQVQVKVQANVQMQLEVQVNIQVALPTTCTLKRQGKNNALFPQYISMTGVWTEADSLVLSKASHILMPHITSYLTYSHASVA